MSSRLQGALAMSSTAPECNTAPAGTAAQGRAGTAGTGLSPGNLQLGFTARDRRVLAGLGTEMT